MMHQEERDIYNKQLEEAIEIDIIKTKLFEFNEYCKYIITLIKTLYDLEEKSKYEDQILDKIFD